MTRRASASGGQRQKKRLENAAQYLSAEGRRELHGLYLDSPEAKDDIYRYLRW